MIADCMTLQVRSATAAHTIALRAGTPRRRHDDTTSHSPGRRLLPRITRSSRRPQRKPRESLRRIAIRWWRRASRNVGLEAESPPALRAVDISSPSLEVGFVSFVGLRDGTSCRRLGQVTLLVLADCEVSAM